MVNKPLPFMLLGEVQYVGVSVSLHVIQIENRIPLLTDDLAL